MEPPALATHGRLVRAACCLLLATGCDGDSARAALGPERIFVARSGEVDWHASSSERFGFAAPTAGPTAPDPVGLSWDTPPGWAPLPPAGQRRLSFRVASDRDAECWLTELAGDGGGEAANVNRWRQQMSLDPLDEAEVAALPRAELFGESAILVDVERSGAETGDGGTNERLIGLVLVGRTSSRFLKMVGPADVLATEREAFLALARSLRVSDADAPSPAQATARFQWKAPEGWVVGPPRRMREVTWFVDGDPACECYVTVLAGDGGGQLANVNRWRGQLGLDPLGALALEELPRLDLLGGEGLLVEGAGSFRGMQDESLPDAGLLGAIGTSGADTVFVKLVGPRAVVDAARDDFIALCESLAESR